MHILFEEYEYRTEDVKDILNGFVQVSNVDATVKLNQVGYFFNAEGKIKDCVFILPKVLMDENDRVFQKHIAPEELLDFAKAEGLTRGERDFIYGFSVWIYRAIRVYNASHPDNGIVQARMPLRTMGRKTRGADHTFLDVVIAIRKFHEENRDFFMYVLKNVHSGYNKVDWTRTVVRSRPVIENEEPVYVDLENRKKQINYDEELFIIFYSILDYISTQFGFPVTTNIGFQLIRGNRFERYINGFGRIRLRQIKYKYFSDKALQMWDLCYAFFDSLYRIRTDERRKEYLLVKNFYTVFEAIINDLIGDDPLPDGMKKEQEDGKIVDHLYTGASLIESRVKKTYYIGDSKYYKIGHELTDESIYKQYTYARNVIQWNIDIFNKGDKPESGIVLRDNITEGYNIIPNFFISAAMDSEFDYSKDGIDTTAGRQVRHSRVHFNNRLFDRDTLLLFHYDVNFLFVLSLYARDKAAEKAQWKRKMRERFKTDIQARLNEEYDFYAVRPHRGVESEKFINENFKTLIGKILYAYDDFDIFSLALDKEYTKENESVLRLLKESFYVAKCPLEKDPREEIDKTMSAQTRPLSAAGARQLGA